MFSPLAIEVNYQIYDNLQPSVQITILKVRSWKDQPLFKLYIDMRIRHAKFQIFTNKYGTLTEHEKDLPIITIGSKIFRILSLQNEEFRFFATTEVEASYQKVCDKHEHVKFANLQLKFDDDNLPYLVSFFDTDLSLSIQRWNYYMGTHLDKIFRKTEEIFKEHAAVVKEIDNENLDVKDYSEDSVASYAGLLQNNLRRLETIEEEQRILNSLLNMNRRVYSQICNSFSFLEKCTFGSSFSVFGFKAIELVPLPLNSERYRQRISSLIPPIV